MIDAEKRARQPDPARGTVSGMATVEPGYYWARHRKGFEDAPEIVEVVYGEVYTVGSDRAFPLDEWEICERIVEPVVFVMVELSCGYVCGYCNGTGVGQFSGRCPTCAGTGRAKP